MLMLKARPETLTFGTPPMSNSPPATATMT